jgi:protein-S-isoprenylcysteine O-methyltransferase Ste14
MHFNCPTIATVSIVTIGAFIAAPVLIKGFTRRGTGVMYEKSFVIQRAPQLAIVINLCLIVLAYLVYNRVIEGISWAFPILTLTEGEPQGFPAIVAWLGVALLASGMVFMIGGWYSLGDCFSTDAEVLDGHTVRSTGLLKYVMHPVYSGIIQCLLGASLAATSIISAAFTLAVLAPLWLARAKYEERILIETLGQAYKEYGEHLGWRRLVPRIFPIGI